MSRLMMADEDPPPLSAQAASAPPKPPRRFDRVIERVVRSVVVRSFSGPLPPPEILAGYKTAFPDCPERIVAMAERQSAHRQSQESEELSGSIVLAKRGPDNRRHIGRDGYLGGIVLVAMDKNVQGFSLIVGAAVVFGGAFVYDRYQRREEEEQEIKDIGKLIGIVPEIGKAVAEAMQESSQPENTLPSP